MSMWLFSASLIFLFIFSSGFHVFQNRLFSVADTLAAFTIIFISFYYIYTEAFNIKISLLLILILLTALYIRFYVENGTRNDTAHGFWHLSAAILISLTLFY